MRHKRRRERERERGAEMAGIIRRRKYEAGLVEYEQEL
jgi:hypothetical protein